MPLSEPSFSGPALSEDLEDLYENAPCGYLSVGPDGRIFKTNRTLCRWLGCTAEALVGTRFSEALTVGGQAFYDMQLVPLLLLQGAFTEVSVELVAPGGSRLPVLMNAAERRAEDGRLLFTRMTVFNATERRRYERELLSARRAADAARAEMEALQQATQAHLLDERATAALREEFIAVLGHDLRNPLAAIDSGMRLLRRSPLDERAVKVVGLVQSSVTRMAGLIEDVMDFARGRLGGGIALEVAAVPLGPVLQQVVDELRASHPGRAIEVVLAMDGPVLCDARRIGQLASNLLGNALTHGDPAGTVRLSAVTDADGFVLTVANDGEIPAALMPRIFEPYARGESRPSLQGLGLGLYICRAIALAHGGTLEVVSGGGGTRFIFQVVLPIDR